MTLRWPVSLGVALGAPLAIAVNLAFAPASFSAPDAVRAPAALVIDGDTFDLVWPGEAPAPPKTRRVRLWGMDAPEIGHKGARAASAHLALLLAGKRGQEKGIVCVPAAPEHQKAQGRLVAECWAGSAPGRFEDSFSCRLVAVGAAWRLAKFDREGRLRACER